MKKNLVICLVLYWIWHVIIRFPFILILVITPHLHKILDLPMVIYVMGNHFIIHAKFNYVMHSRFFVSKMSIASAKTNRTGFLYPCCDVEGVNHFTLVSKICSVKVFSATTHHRHLKFEHILPVIFHLMGSVFLILWLKLGYH